MADDTSISGSVTLISTLRLGVEALNNVARVMGAAFPRSSGTSPSATAGAATLPANPVGFITVTLPDGTAAKVPYYG